MTPYYNVYESGIITTMTSIKHFSIAFGALALMLLVSFLIVNNSTQFRSVEFGLVALSPRGVGGGYAMPASGASAPTGLQYSCSSSGTSVNLSWGGSSYQGALPSDEKLAKAAWEAWVLEAFATPVAHAGGGDGGGGGGGDNGGGSNTAPSPLDWGTPSHSHSIPAPVSYEVQISSLGTYYTSSTAYTASIVPERAYSWSVRACAGGECSAWQAGANFTCYAPPTVSLTADQYSIPYNTSTTLRWTSQYTNSCSASGAWSGSKPLSGSESTGNLTKQTTYLLQCSGPRGSTSPSSATISMIYGTGADVTACKSVVRKDESFCLNWDTGTSVPQYCVIQAGTVVIAGPLQSKTGSLDWSIAGETEFTLNCEEGGNINSTTVKVLPEFQET